MNRWLKGSWRNLNGSSMASLQKRPLFLRVYAFSPKGSWTVIILDRVCDFFLTHCSAIPIFKMSDLQV